MIALGDADWVGNLPRFSVTLARKKPNEYGRLTMKVKPQHSSMKMDSFRRPTFVIALVTLGTIPVEFLNAMLTLQSPMNSQVYYMATKGMEIGVARCSIVADVLAMSKPPTYILWLSDDDLPPADGLIKLWMEAENNKWDVITSLVHLKSDPPEQVLVALEEDWEDGDVVTALIGNMGFALTRTDLFRRIEPPWFKTGFTTNGQTMSGFTEDTWFFDRCEKIDAKVAVHTGVKSGHLDVATGRIY